MQKKQRINDCEYHLLLQGIESKDSIDYKKISSYINIRGDP